MLPSASDRRGVRARNGPAPPGNGEQEFGSTNARTRRAATLDAARRALLLAAHVVDQHGEAYLPLFVRLEKEIARLQADDPLARARALLEQPPIPSGEKR